MNSKSGHRFSISMVLGFFALLAANAALFLCAAGFGYAAETDLVTAISQVAKANIPAVVHIEVTERREVPNPFSPFENDPFFRHFFGNSNRGPRKFEQEKVGLGSGMIIDNEGNILTNNHVVSGATKIKVVLADGREFTEKQVKVIGTDAKTDLAVIRIMEKHPLPTVKFGDSDKLEIGQWVVAIGHPRGLDQTVTHGIISAMHRMGITDPSGYQDFLQTDAAINPGNSGGPLLNLQGEVIGINTAILSQSGGFEGLGFAVPINMAAHVVKQLIGNGKVVRGWLGVNIQTLTPDLAKSFGVPDTKGVLVAQVTKDGPAEKAGLLRGDVITAFDGKDIQEASTLRNFISVTAVGQEVGLTIARDGRKQDIRVKVGSEEEEKKALEASIRQRLGADVRALTAKETENYGLNSGQGGVLVDVDPRGALGKAGFESGDIILQVNNQTVEGPDGLESILNALGRRQELVVILVLDHASGQASRVRVQLP